MKNLHAFVIFGAIAVAIVSGTITVQFHLDRLLGLGGWAVSQFSSFSFAETVRDQVISLQRQGQDYVVKDKTKVADTALEQSKADAIHLGVLADKASNTNTITPAAKLLLASLTKLTNATKDITVEHLNQMRPEIAKVFADTNVTLAILKSQGAAVDDFMRQSAELTKTIEASIGTLQAGMNVPSEEPRDSSQTVNPTPTPTPAIPFRF